MVGENSQWDDSEIINTFEPIIEFVDHMVSQKIVLTEFSLKNIVVTEDQRVKFMDSFLQS
jgi:RIO-like serine/threonine protein kinase